MREVMKNSYLWNRIRVRVHVKSPRKTSTQGLSLPCLSGTEGYSWAAVTEQRKHVQIPKITTCSCVPSCPADTAFSYLLAERLQPWDWSFCLFSLPLAQKPHVQDVGFMSGCWYTPFLWRTSSLYVINLKIDDFVDQESTRNKNLAAAQ